MKRIIIPLLLLASSCVTDERPNDCDAPISVRPELAIPDTLNGIGSDGEPIVIMSLSTWNAHKDAIERSHNWMRQAELVLVACRGHL